MATATASGGAPLVVVKESGAKGLSGTDGTDGAGFNQVRQSKLDNPLLHLFKTNQLQAVSAPLNTEADLTWTRATEATFADRYGVIQSAAIDVPREEKGGWLIEGASTNLALYSEEFDNAGYTKTRCSITPNDAIAPDGQLTADKLVEDATAANNHQIRELYSVITGTMYTYSIYVNAAERDQIRILLSDTGFGVNVTYDFTDFAAGTIVESGAGTNSSAKIEQISTDWYRVSVTAEATATVSANMYVYLLVLGGTTYDGDGSSGLHIWGVQLEVLPFASSYIQTTSASVTRGADIVNVQCENNTAVDIYSWSFTLEMLGVAIGDGTTLDTMLQIQTEDAGTSCAIQFASGNAITVVTEGNSDGLGSHSPNETINITISRLSSTSLSSLVDGVTFVDTLIPDAAKEIKPTGTIHIGRRSNGTANAYFRLKDLRLYDFGLNADEQAYLAG